MSTATVETAVARTAKLGWRLWLRSRYLLLQRHRHDRLVLEAAAGLPLIVLPGVLNPKLFRTGEFLAAALDHTLVPPGSSVLDMGTGTGIGALAAARLARRVVAVDINPDAVRCARINALLNRMEDRVEVREGDLFAPVPHERFDVVLFNPPFLPGVPGTPLEHAFRAGDVAARFAAGLQAHLRPGGHALVLLSSHGDEGGYLAALSSAGLADDVVAEQSSAGERLTLHRLRQDGT